MKALIVDDEGPARLEMRRLLSVHPVVEVAGEAADVDTALELTARLEPEIVFLDIQLAGESGFDYVARCPEPHPHIVFVTAHDQYAVRGFECNALDYLLKPVHPDRLVETLRRVSKRGPRETVQAGKDDLLYLKGTSLARFVRWSEVISILAEGNYTRVRLEDGTSPLIRRALKDWTALAPEDAFFQTHRTALVQRDAVREIRKLEGGSLQLVLSDGSVIPVGRAYRGQVRAALGLA
jgi:two-component system LytT family response regulator